MPFSLCSAVCELRNQLWEGSSWGRLEQPGLWLLKTDPKQKAGGSGRRLTLGGASLEAEALLCLTGFMLGCLPELCHLEGGWAVLLAEPEP